MIRFFDGYETREVRSDSFPPNDARSEDLTPTSPSSVTVASSITGASLPKGKSLISIVDPDLNAMNNATVHDSPIKRVRLYLGIIVIAVVLVIVVVIVALSIRKKSTPVSNAPVPASQTLNDTTNPTISPPTIPTEQQLTVACNFLNYSNVPECQSNTVFGSETVGNTIPTELGLLTQLTHLDIFGSQLTGTIPSELGNLINLKVLILGINDLSSTIPSELGNLVAMNFINLGTNQLNGTIPSTFGNLIYVTNMYLDNNELTGLIPSSALENLLDLTVLDLYANPQLFGTIPPSMCNRSNIVIGIDCSTGRIDCSCCGFSNRTECPSTGGGYYGGF